MWFACTNCGSANTNYGSASTNCGSAYTNFDTNHDKSIHKSQTRTTTQFQSHCEKPQKLPGDCFGTCTPAVWEASGSFALTAKPAKPTDVFHILTHQVDLDVFDATLPPCRDSFKELGNPTRASNVRRQHAQLINETTSVFCRLQA